MSLSKVWRLRYSGRDGPPHDPTDSSQAEGKILHDVFSSEDHALFEPIVDRESEVAKNSDHALFMSGRLGDHRLNAPRFGNRQRMFCQLDSQPAILPFVFDKNRKLGDSMIDIGRKSTTPTILPDEDPSGAFASSSGSATIAIRDRSRENKTEWPSRVWPL